MSLQEFLSAEPDRDIQREAYRLLSHDAVKAVLRVVIVLGTPTSPEVNIVLSERRFNTFWTTTILDVLMRAEMVTFRKKDATFSVTVFGRESFERYMAATQFFWEPIPPTTR